MPRSDNEGLLQQSNRSKRFWVQHQIPGGAVAAASLPFKQVESAVARILVVIKVCRGSIPLAFFVLHPAATQNRSLKTAKLAITLYSRLFVYIRMYAHSRYDVL